MNSAATRMMLCTMTRSRATASTFPHVIQQYQHRHFSRPKSKKREDPFKVLGIQKDEPYSKAKASFIAIAMSHHPDTSVAANKEERDDFRDIFIRARRAFEQLTEGNDGEIILKREKKEMEGEKEMMHRVVATNCCVFLRRKRVCISSSSHT